MARAYLEAVLSVLGFWRRMDCRSAASAELGTLSDGAVTVPGYDTLSGDGVMGPGDGTLGCGNIVGYMVGRDVASIFCMVLMASICSYPTENGDAAAELLRASVKSSTD